MASFLFFTGIVPHCGQLVTLFFHTFKIFLAAPVRYPFSRTHCTAVCAKASTTGSASPSGIARAMVRLAWGSRRRTARFSCLPRSSSYGTMETPSPCSTMARMA